MDRHEAVSAELRERVEVVTRDLANRRKVELERLFREIESPPPLVQWEPRAEDLTSRHLRFLLEYWAAKPRPRDLPLSETIDALELWPALGYVMLLEPIDGGVDFRYRVYGTTIAKHSGIEMTGKGVWAMPSPMVAVYLLATYRAVMQERRVLHTQHTTHQDIQLCRWDRVILPFVNASGRIDRLLVGNVPSIRML